MLEGVVIECTSLEALEMLHNHLLQLSHLGVPRGQGGGGPTLRGGLLRVGQGRSATNNQPLLGAP